MNKFKFCLLGLMSGSSLDGLDITCCEFETDPVTKSILNWKITCSETIPYTEEWISRLAHLPQASALAYARTHTYFGHYMGKMVCDFITKYQLQPDYIDSHGHTIFHEPERGMTAQIGDGAALAALTGIPVISDFRTKDVALFGQGAPLAPIADKYLFPGYDCYLNLGGIANMTFRNREDFIAFDICAANQLLNTLAGLAGQEMDAGGAIAAKGKLNTVLLDASFQDPFFEKPFPKSLGNQYVREHFIPLFRAFEAPVPDLLHTACEHIAILIDLAVKQSLEHFQLPPASRRMLVTGGGAFNSFLMERISQQLAPLGVAVVVPEPVVVKYKEAALMAVLGLLRILRLPNTLKSVTGASQDSSGGCIYL